MNKRYPSIRMYERDSLFVHDFVTMTFFMPHPHRVVAPAVWRALQLFLKAIPPDTMKWYVTWEGEWEPLGEEEMRLIERSVFTPPYNEGWSVELADTGSMRVEYSVEYIGRKVLEPPDERLNTSAVGFTLPTEYLERHGPQHVRDLALALATELPFSFGQVSLALTPGPLMQQETRALLVTYPGLDLCHLDSASETIGTGARGAYWLTFLGQPLLGQLGGLESLRQRLPFPDISFHALDKDRALLTVGEWPELAEQRSVPSLCALARLLEPFFPNERIAHLSWRQEDSDIWLRRLCL